MKTLIFLILKVTDEGVNVDELIAYREDDKHTEADPVIFFPDEWPEISWRHGSLGQISWKHRKTILLLPKKMAYKEKSFVNFIVNSNGQVKQRTRSFEALTQHSIKKHCAWLTRCPIGALVKQGGKAVRVSYNVPISFVFTINPIS